MKIVIGLFLAASLGLGLQALPLGGPATTLVLKNQTGFRLMHLYVSPNTAFFYGQDRTEGEPIPRGATVEIEVSRCDRQYDIRAELLGENRTIEMRVPIAQCGQPQPVTLQLPDSPIPSS